MNKRIPDEFLYFKKLIREVDNDGVNLTDWEIDFISGFIDEPEKIERLSPAQQETIEKIHRRRCNRT